MEAEGKSLPKRQTRKRSLLEPQEPRAKRRPAGTAAVAAENTAAAVAVSTHPPRQLDDGITSGSALDGQSSTAGLTSASAEGTVHLCGHCQKRFRSPGKLAQHERVHATETVPFHSVPQTPKNDSLRKFNKK